MDGSPRPILTKYLVLAYHIWTSNCSDCICPVFVLFSAKIFALSLSNSHQPNLSELFLYLFPFANKNQGQVWPIFQSSFAAKMFVLSFRFHVRHLSICWFLLFFVCLPAKCLRCHCQFPIGHLGVSNARWPAVQLNPFHCNYPPTLFTEQLQPLL